MGGARVWVGNLSARANERDLENFFRGFGRLRDVMVKNGFGFVVYFYQFLVNYSKFRNLMMSGMLKTLSMNKMDVNCLANELWWNFPVENVSIYNYY